MKSLIPDWFSAHWQRTVLPFLGLGFAAGLPYGLILMSMSIWLKEIGVATAVIGYLNWFGFFYSFKFFWSPAVDCFELPILKRFGHRHSWILATQLLMIVGILCMSFIDPQLFLTAFIACAACVVVMSSIQDLAIDALRVEQTPSHLQAVSASLYIFGYRIALLLSTSVVLMIVDDLNWPSVYRLMGAMMLIGVISLFFVQPSPKAASAVKERFSLLKFLNTFYTSIEHFFVRYRGWAAFLLFIVAFYRVVDIVLGNMVMLFYLDLGFSKAEIGAITKLFGFFMTMFGAFCGGAMVIRFNLAWTMLWGILLSLISNFGFLILGAVGHSTMGLGMLIAADNFGGGLANVALIAFMAKLLTDRAFTATQYALMSSLTTLPGKLLAGFSGKIVEIFGYATFFVYTIGLGIPALIGCLLYVYYSYSKREHVAYFGTNDQ